MPIRKETRSLADVVADVASRKSAAAKARFAGTPPGQEAPREVYLAACTSIGTHLAAYGFKYAKSGPRARRRSGDFTFEISFQSSHHNIGGNHVALWIHANVLSARMKTWRERQAHLQPFDFVAGGQIGNLQANHCWCEWDLAKRRKRDETIRDAINSIEELAFPYFVLFEDVPALVQKLAQEEIPEFSIDRAIEFLMCFADQPTARLAAATFLRTRRELRDDYVQSYQFYARDGIAAKRESGYAEQLAFASHVYDFGDLTAESA